MIIDNSQPGYISEQRITKKLPTKSIEEKGVESENDFHSFSHKALSLYEEGLSSLTERPVIIVEIKPKPP